MKHLVKGSRSLLYSWILSYLAILLLPVVINISVYFQFHAILRTQITNYTTSMVEQVKKEIDYKFGELKKMAMEISFDSNIRTLLSARSEADFYTYFSDIQTFSNMNESIARYAPITPITEESYIFAKNSNLVWCNNNIYTEELFYQIKGNDQTISGEEWKQFANPHSSLSNIQFLANGKPYISYPLPPESNHPKANFVAVLDRAAIAEVFSQAAAREVGQYYITTLEQKQVFSTSPHMEELNLPLSDGFFDQNVNQEDSYIYATSSDILPLRYICVIPKSYISKQTEAIQLIMLISTLFCLVIGVIMVLILSKRNYNPIHELVSLVSRKSQERADSVNIYQYLQDSILELYEKGEDLTERMLCQNEAVRANYLARMLHGGVQSHENVEDALNVLEISFTRDQFLVVLFYLEGKGEAIRSNANHLEGGYLRFFRKHVLGHITDHLEDYQTHCTEIENMVVCIVSFDGETENWKQQLSFALKQGAVALEQGFGLWYTVSVSGICHSLSALPDGYLEAMEAMEYRLFGYTNEVLFYDALVNRVPDAMGINRDYERKLENLLAVGDQAATLDLVHTLLREASANTPSVEGIKCLIFDLARACMHLISKPNLYEQERMQEDFNRLERIFNRPSLDAMTNELMECVMTICTHITAYKSSHADDSIQNRIDTIIELHFSNKNLSVSMISEQLGMNPKYLSTVYKETAGSSLVDAIHRKRIAVFKEIIRAENISIALAADRVGYSSVNTLTRLFKKHEGITPGQMKELIQRND